METFMKDAVLFIHEYRNMENSDTETNEQLIKRVIFPEWVGDHLCDSWNGRKNNFGDFFLNLDHETQADFIEAWGIQIPGLQEYKTALEKDAMAILFAAVPPTLAWLHELVKYFYNNGIDDKKSLILSNLPDEDKRYGNSTNWGNYILSLSGDGRELVLRQLYNQVMAGKL